MMRMSLYRSIRSLESGSKAADIAAETGIEAHKRVLTQINTGSFSEANNILDNA